MKTKICQKCKKEIQSNECFKVDGNSGRRIVEHYFCDRPTEWKEEVIE
jgi:hypothetical protein